MVKHETTPNAMICFLCSCTSLDLNMLTIPCLPL
jgi:hypothetical protein